MCLRILLIQHQQSVCCGSREFDFRSAESVSREKELNKLRLLIRVLVQLVALATLVSCGGGGGGDTAHSPSISNLSYSPSSAFASPNGTVAVTGTMNVSDAGGDVTQLRMTTSGGADLSIPVSLPSGATTGLGTGQFVVSVDKTGTYTFEIWAVDLAGNSSNHLTGTFEVVLAVNPERAPSISNLRLAPTSVTQLAGGIATVSAYVDFADADGDVSAVRVKSSAGLDVTIPTPSLQGSTKGTATAQWSVSIDQAGPYTLDIWAVDREGLTSNHLSATFEVLAPSTAPHAPSISNLRFSPSSATEVWSGTTSVTATVDFADTGADIASARIVAAGLDQTIPVASFSGSKSGTGSVTFAFPVNQAGTYGFSLFVTDSLGNTSNSLTGSFEVLAATTAPWVKLAVSPPATLYGVAWNGRQYVAVGGAGAVMTSADSVNWQTQNSGVQYELRSVAASGSRFVAVGNTAAAEAVVIGSADGVTWSVLYRSAPSTSYLSKVTWTGAQFIAIGQENVSSGHLYGFLLTSPDGLVWTQRGPQAIELGDPGFLGRKSMTSIASSGSVTVATGLTTTEDPATWVSSDLNGWTASVLPEAVWLVAPSDITWGNGRFVAVNPVPGWDSGPPTFVSTDGRNWQASAATLNLPGMEAVTSGPDGFLAVSGFYRMSSPDGLAWTVSPMVGCGNAVLWDGARYISVGSSICKSH